MSKLFSNEKFKERNLINSSLDTEMHDNINNINELILEDRKLSNAYIQLSALKDYTEENYEVAFTKHHEKINNYIKTICLNIGYEDYKILTISTESFYSLETKKNIQSIAIEGFLVNIWEKIKAVFNKIFEKIKQFYQRFFTRYGRIDAKLKNLSEVLSELGDKKLKTGSIEKAPKGIVKYFGIESTIDYGLISDLVNNTFILNKEITNVVKNIAGLAKVPILTSDELKNIKKIKEEIEKNKESLADKEANLKTREENKGFFDKFKKDEVGSALKSDINKIKEETSKKEETVKKTEEFVSSVPEINEENAKSKIAEEFNKIKELIENLSKKVNGLKLVSHKVIKVKENLKEDDIEYIEIYNNSDSVSEAELVLADKKNLSKLIKMCQDAIKNSESVLNIFNENLSLIQKQISEIDKTIKTLDKEEDERYKKYKNYVSNLVRPRLIMLKSVTLYTASLVNTFKTLELDACEGSINYAIECLKYYG